MVKIQAFYLSKDDVFQLGRLCEQCEAAWPDVTVACTELRQDGFEFIMALVFMGDDADKAVVWFRHMMTSVRWHRMT